MSNEQLLEVRTEGKVLITKLSVASISAMSAVEGISQLLREAVREHEPDYLIVDFSDVRFFSSQMLGLLVDVWRRLRENGGAVVISGIDPQLTRVFRITNLDKLFSFYETTEKAISAIQTN